MECKIEAENAKVLDKLVNQFPCTNITIQTTSNLLMIQVIQEDNSLIGNISLNNNFFAEYNCKKPQIQNIVKVKFYKQKMKVLHIKLTDYIFRLVWEFDTYKHKKEIYISDTDLYKLEYTIYQYVYIESKLFYEILKHFDCKNVELEFANNNLQLKTKERKIDISCSMDIESDIMGTFEIPTHNLRRIFALYDIFEKFCVGVGETRETINVLIEHLNLSVSIFCAAYV